MENMQSIFIKYVFLASTDDWAMPLWRLADNNDYKNWYLRDFSLLNQT